MLHVLGSDCAELSVILGFPSGKESAPNAEDSSSVPGSGRCPGEGNGNPLQYSGLGNPLTKELGRYSPQDCKRAGCDLATKQQIGSSRMPFCSLPLYSSTWKTTLFIKYLLSSYQMLPSIPGTGDKAVKKTRFILTPASWSLHSRRETTSK